MTSEVSLKPITFQSYPRLQFQCGASFLVPKVSKAWNETQALRHTSQVLSITGLQPYVRPAASLQVTLPDPVGSYLIFSHF